MGRLKNLFGNIFEGLLDLFRIILVDVIPLSLIIYGVVWCSIYITPLIGTGVIWLFNAEVRLETFWAFHVSVIAAIILLAFHILQLFVKRFISSSPFE